jgi:MULE transposase domain
MLINPETNQLQNLFFAHPDAVALYKKHPDVILIDCTYKTNRFHMPLLNICSVTGNKKTVQIALCFMSGEKESDYKWAVNCFQDLISENSIEQPLSIVTDRELALMNCLDEIFLDSTHLLCTWHVNMNILANCRKHFPSDKKQGDTITIDPKWEDFLKDWSLLLNSSTRLEYAARLAKFRIHSAVAVSYVEDTWLKWKEKLVKLWVDSKLHFGIRVTSPIEGCHAGLKVHLKISTGDLRSVFIRLIPYWPMQHFTISTAAAQEQNKVKHHLNKGYLHRIQSLVYDQALQLIVKEVTKLNKAKSTNPILKDCTCIIQTSMGLPCFHTVSQRLEEGGYIMPEDIHPFWWYTRPEPGTYAVLSVPKRLVLDPALVRGKGRPKGAKGKKGSGIEGTFIIS